MLVTGYMLRRAIRTWEGRRDTAAMQFGASLSVFPTEKATAVTPDAISDRFLQAERNISMLQLAQTRYNLHVKLKTGEPLCSGVKRLGGLGRLEKMWREVASPKKDPYGYNRDTREAGTVYKEETVTRDHGQKRAEEFARMKSELTEAVAVANGQEVNIEGLEDSLFL